MSYDFSFDKKSAILIVIGCVAIGILLFLAGYIVGLDKGQGQMVVQAGSTPAAARPPAKSAEKEPTEAEKPAEEEKPPASAAASKKSSPAKALAPAAPAGEEGKASAAPSDTASAAKEGEAKEKDKDKANFSLQLGAFQTEENALKLKEKLKAKGYPVYLFRVQDKDGNLWHTVRMGYYGDTKEASHAAAKVTSKERMSVWVRPSNAF